SHVSRLHVVPVLLLVQSWKSLHVHVLCLTQEGVRQSFERIAAAVASGLFSAAQANRVRRPVRRIHTCGSLSFLDELHDAHAGTRFHGASAPPPAIGWKWSTAVAGSAQLTHTPPLRLSNSAGYQGA